MTSEKVLALIFSDLHERSLKQLTERRTLASVPFGGRYRMIDFTLSNIVNSGITEVGVITKQNYHSLMDHLGSGSEWDLARKREGLFILPPMSHAPGGVYNTRIEALDNVTPFIEGSKADYILLADSSTVYNMDYRPLIEAHGDRGADISIVYTQKSMQELPVDANDVVSLTMNPQGRVSKIAVAPAKKGVYNVSMGVVLMAKELLLDLIQRAKSESLHSFDRDILQGNVKKRMIFGFAFEGFSRHIDGMKSFFEANMDLLDHANRKALFLRERPIYTKTRDEFPATYGLGSRASNSFIADGALIEGHVENSIIFRGVRIGKNAVVKNCIIMQGCTVSDGCSLGYVVTDKNVHIGEGRTLQGYESYPVFIEKGSII